jgi:hypothetical protein
VRAINVQGADHHSTTTRVRAGLQALGIGIPEGYPDYVLHQMVTVTRGAGHPFEPDVVTELSGATVSGGSINGQHKVTSATATSYTFPAPAGVGSSCPNTSTSASPWRRISSPCSR